MEPIRALAFSPEESEAGKEKKQVLQLEIYKYGLEGIIILEIKFSG